MFTGRQNELSQITVALASKQRAALVGMPGVGKSTTAIQWANDNRDSYKYGFYIIADTQENTRAGYHKAAQELLLPGVTPEDEAGSVQTFLKWLHLASNALVVLDNADDIEKWPALLPPRGAAHILLTARPDSLNPSVELVRVPVMDNPTGATCLLEWARIPTPSNTQQDDAHALSDDLGGLPLALRQAGRYCAVTGCSLEDYRFLFAERQAEVLNARTLNMSAEEKTVYQTFQITLAKLTETYPAALEFLRICAFLSPDDIPENIFTAFADALPPTLTNYARDPMKWNELRSALRHYALINADTEAKMVSVHRLVQAVVRADIDDSNIKKYIHCTVSILNQASPAGEYDDWDKREILLSHQLVCFDSIRRTNIVSLQAAYLLSKTGTSVYNRALYDVAKSLYEHSLKIRELIGGVNHQDTARVLSRIFAIYQIQGDYTKASVYGERAIAVSEVTRGLNHPETAQCINNLGHLYYLKNEYTKAENLLTRALAIREVVLEPNDYGITVSLNNLALVYKDTGRFEEAEGFSERVLKIREATLEPNHPSLARILANLGHLYALQGKYDKSEPLSLRALAIREVKFGENHPDTAESLCNIANLRRRQELHTEEEKLLQRATHIYEAIFGPANPSTVQCYYLWANALESLGRSDDARKKRAQIPPYITITEKYPVPSQQPSPEPLSWRPLVIRRRPKKS